MIDGYFPPTMQFEKLEIHTGFLRFPNFYLEKELSLLILTDSISASLSPGSNSKCFVMLTIKPLILIGMGGFYIMEWGTMPPIHGKNK